MCLLKFQKRAPFFNSITAHLGVISKLLYYTECVPPNILLQRAYIWVQNHVKFWFRGVFPQKGQTAIVEYIWKPVATHVYNTNIQVPPLIRVNFRNAFG